MKESVNNTWITLPGMILSNPENPPSITEAKAMCGRGHKTSFIIDDVFSFDGFNEFTTVVVNRIDPVYHLLYIPFEDFMKEFFK